MADPTFQNLGFELAGAAPGLAAGWTLALQASAEEIAGYAPAPERPQEDFERAWLDPDQGKVFCLSTGPSRESVMRVHERAGHATGEVYELTVEV